jgi:hypothetical protein
MAKHSFHFRTYASDETENWTLPDALKGATAFGLYFFLEGEATHICSFEANSRVEFLENVFVEPDDPEAAERELDRSDLRHENDGDWTSYFGFIDVASPRTAPYIGERETFTLDTRDFTLDPDEYAGQLEKSLRFGVSYQQAHADAQRACLREFAFEAAREEFGCNSPSDPPILRGGEVLAEHHRRAKLRAAEYAERHGQTTAPLFQAAGVTVPLATGPR